MDAREIAERYKAAPEASAQPDIQRAYRYIAHYVSKEFTRLTANEGWRFVSIFDADFLPDLKTCAHVRAIPVLDSNHEHPLFSDAENFEFRAVHDVRGHIEGNVFGYSFEDEQAAWKQQNEHFTRWDQRHGAHDTYWSLGNLARKLLFTEIVGQAAYFATFGEFPNQKVAVV